MAGPVYCVYVDDSHDAENTTFVLCALCIPSHRWRDCHDIIVAHRSELRAKHGIYARKELHAAEFVHGRGRIIRPPKVVPRSLRAQLFKRHLEVMARLPEASLISACTPWKSRDIAFERALNRINVMARKKGGHVVLFCDAGNERAYTAMARRMKQFNPVQSNQGKWADTGESWKNIPLDRFIDDPVFRDSADSHFIQCVDFAAFALLRRECPTERMTAAGIDKAYAILRPIMNTAASGNDPEGIIRL